MTIRPKPTTKRLPHAPRIPDDRWDQLKPYLEQLYLVENLPVKVVMHRTRTEKRFNASEKQYRYRFEKWKWTKYRNEKSDQTTSNTMHEGYQRSDIEYEGDITTRRYRNLCDQFLCVFKEPCYQVLTEDLHKLVEEVVETYEQSTRLNIPISMENIIQDLLFRILQYDAHWIDFVSHVRFNAVLGRVIERLGNEGPKNREDPEDAHYYRPIVAKFHIIEKNPRYFYPRHDSSTADYIWNLFCWVRQQLQDVPSWADRLAHFNMLPLELSKDSDANVPKHQVQLFVYLFERWMQGTRSHQCYWEQLSGLAKFTISPAEMLRTMSSCILSAAPQEEAPESTTDPGKDYGALIYFAQRGIIAIENDFQISKDNKDELVAHFLGHFIWKHDPRHLIDSEQSQFEAQALSAAKFYVSSILLNESDNDSYMMINTDYEAQAQVEGLPYVSL
ncbi:uncharacterized protein GGS25DRAFT_215588 [Hypoxylon fragiforme]|uniref:uncharacterized protein n=1 Tax=Hypoxylon fragiforme TaxID=63214 RepID=UPI0020C6D6EC|nr:uncharacterized protein GGS25DRAFT_215588 [Hypoxylon fragiforme]KAI2609419.1 hypothetical protein GGS25DRAFT_215588 [Hypoxylon fragiforme]